MKRYLLLIVRILMFVSINDSYSQCCINPLDEVTITRNVTIGGVTCMVNIKFCHNVSPLGIRYIKICSVTIPHGCGWTNVDLSGRAFWDLIYYELLVYSNSIYSFPPCASINQLASNIEISKATCWTILDDFIAMESKLLPCSGEPAICYVEYVICWENGELKRKELNRWVVGENDCYYDGEVPFNPYNTDPPFCFDNCY